MELNAPQKEMGLSPLYIIARNLERLIPGWEDLEIETLSLELGIIFDDLTRDKLFVLQTLRKHPQTFFNDVLFFLHSVDVINNNVAEFDNFPFPTSLEIAYAYAEIKVLFKGSVPAFGSPIIKTIQYILTHEGYSEPVWPFDEIGIKSEVLAKGQTEEDTKNKEKAIKAYIRGLNGNDNRISN